MDRRKPNPASAGVLAAELLAAACGPGGDLRARTVRDLAEDLGRVLAATSEAGTPGAPVEAALACADLATLAACNAAALPGEDGPAAVAAAHLAAGTTRALVTLAEADGTDAAAEVRSAGWKADLAVQQLS